MSEPFLGEIKLFSYPFAPRGWAFCNGAILPIQQNQALYSLLGTVYGGNGVTTFALPDLRGRVPVHVGGTITLGQAAGQEAHTLTIIEMPMHTHFAKASSEDATDKTSNNTVWAKTQVDTYNSESNSVMSQNALTNTGNSQPHNNMQPYTVLNYCIAIQGIYPSRN